MDSDMKHTRSYGKIKRIHINKHIIRANTKNGTNNPALTIQMSTGQIRTHAVKIVGTAILLQAGTKHPDTGKVIKPLSCGARVWLETKDDVYFIK